MNPLLTESLARQHAHATSPARIPRRRRSARPAPRPIVRLGEALIALGTKLACARFDPSLVGARESC